MNAKIEWSKAFAKRPVADQITYLKKLASSQNSALDAMQKERNVALEKLATAQMQLANANSALVIQKQIVVDALTKSNEDGQQTTKRIHELESRVKAQDAVIEALNGDID